MISTSDVGTLRRHAVIVGYGPVGRTVDRVLRERNIETVVVDLNMDTIRSLTQHLHFHLLGGRPMAWPPG